MPSNTSRAHHENAPHIACACSRRQNSQTSQEPLMPSLTVITTRQLSRAGRTSDGVIEAIEHPRPDRFVLAVQWHPELGWENDGLSQRLFRRFINEAAFARESVLVSLSTPA